MPSNEKLFEILIPYLASLHDLGIRLQSQEQDYFFLEVGKQHVRFCDRYGFDPKLVNFDECQVVAWAPFLIASVVATTSDQRKAMLGLSIGILRRFVRARGNAVSDYWASMVWEMGYYGYSEKKNEMPEFETVSIGKNGLYSSFMTAAYTGPSDKKRITKAFRRMIVASLFSAPA